MTSGRLALRIAQCRRKRAVGGGGDQLGDGSRRGLRALVHHVVPAPQRGIANQQARRVVEPPGGTEAVGVIGNGEEIERAFELRRHPGARDHLLSARETQRLYGVLDRRLEGRAFIAGEYSIADIACWPWVVSHAGHGIALDDFPNVKRWFEAIRQRPATQRAFADYHDPYAHPKFDLRREEATA